MDMYTMVNKYDDRNGKDDFRKVAKWTLADSCEKIRRQKDQLDFSQLPSYFTTKGVQSTLWFRIQLSARFKKNIFNYIAELVRNKILITRDCATRSETRA